ncbi:FAD-dependent 5-carboxymethylaminomethyl-2-thiouridine(34) oxidoreductase MnmC [Limnohabitans sp.]|uniref:FAD-dependent 5-carboxymethylaminomethyl-2-thiouridine(34) oxidoreductase MnmC n=1 Tax=Limnohabitans sp. TaxID=1907725 RepID=UPI003341278B
MALTPSAQTWTGFSNWCHTQASFDELAFLRLWHTWAADAHRPTHLHVVAQTEQPLQADTLLKAAASDPKLLPLAQQLAEQCWGLLPGIHRLRFALKSDEPYESANDDARLMLTLCVGKHEDWPEFVDVLCAHTTGPCATPIDVPALNARTVTIIGAGIAGAGTARALAERGWQVTVLDAGTTPAAGASGLPVGVVAPHTSHDDSGVSRLSRAGLRLMEQTMQALLTEGVDWGRTGVRERRLPGKTRRGGVPLSWLNEHAHTANNWTHKAPAPAPDDAFWHPRGAWLRPAQLVRALLNHPNIRWQGHAKVDALQRTETQWQALQGNTVLAQSSRLVLAAGPGSAALIATATGNGSAPRINPLRGQISWGLMADLPADAHMPATPVNGNGSFVHNITTPDGLAWFAGATYDRIHGDARLLDSDHTENLERLHALEPQTAAALAPLFATVGTDAPRVHGWAGVRCGVHDRLPMTGRVPNAPEGLYMNTAMGSRGLTLGLLCGELLAAQWHGEPLPVEERLAQFLNATRFRSNA